MSYKTDIEIARSAQKKPIFEIGESLNIPAADLVPFGHDKAKISQSFINSVQDRPNGKLILVTAINPTPAGEGKTTTTVEGQELKIYDSAQVKGTGTAGEVVSVSDEGVTVQANGGRILIKRVRADEGKVPANEWANKAGITAGMTLGQ